LSYTALLLIVLAAFIHATWNLLAKRAAHAGPAFVFYYSAIASLAYLPWAVWLVLDGALTLSLPVLLCVVASGVLHLAYSLFLQRGYQVADLSVVYPIARGTGPMLSTIGAFLLLGESPTTYGLLGLIAIVAGIILISTQGNLAKFLQPEAITGVRWGTVTGGAIAGYTVVDAYGVKVLGIHPVILDWCSNTMRVITLLPWMMRNLHVAHERMRKHWWLAIAVGVLSPMSYILVLLALRMGAPLSLTAPAREMSMMVGALFGMFILREKVGPGRLLGCAILIAGVILLGMA
jgi:drug/metabolite transporter (DMT)-like permease